MDLSQLLTVPVIVAAVVLVVLSAWIGFRVGKSREVARKMAALADAEMTRKLALNEMRSHHERKLDALVMANAEQLDQVKQGHAGEIERLHNEHVERIGRLNDANNANLNALKKEHEGQFASLQERHGTEMERLRKAHTEATEARAAEHRQAIAVLTVEHQRQVQQMRDEYVRLGVERDGLAQTVAELNQSVAELQNRIKETRLNNMLSVSKSGEKLIRVVRSVQELATELDETSRAVTDGEYSFFAEIKDMRDKETVLRLAGGEPVHSQELPATEGPDTEGALAKDPASPPAGEGEPATGVPAQEAGPAADAVPGGDWDGLDDLGLPADAPLLAEAEGEIPADQETPREGSTQAV